MNAEPTQKIIQGKHALDDIWSLHRDYLRRILIGMTRDIDLADDLLQETYLRARTKYHTYRGGDICAWLATIARRIAITHQRRYLHRHDILLEEGCVGSDAWPGSIGHLTSISLHDTITSLSPSMRSALLLRHYGGLSYAEIAEELSCTETTARQQVWRAMCKLRDALAVFSKEVPTMKCSDLAGHKLLDYLYQAITPGKRSIIDKHLTECSSCRDNVHDMMEVIRALDANNHDYLVTEIVELDKFGIPRMYNWARITNDTDQIMETSWWMIMKDIIVEYAAFQNGEVRLEITGESDTQFKYEAKLPKSAAPGEQIDTLLVIRNESNDYLAKRLDDKRWRYSFGTTPNSDKAWIMVAAIRLPDGASLVSADPKPLQIKATGTTTLIWRSLLEKVYQMPDGTLPWQFDCTVEYEF